MPEVPAIERLINESSLIAVLLLVAVIWLWRALSQERQEHMASLRAQIEQQEMLVRMTEQLKASLESHTKVLDALNARIK